MLHRSVCLVQLPPAIRTWVSRRKFAPRVASIQTASCTRMNVLVTKCLLNVAFLYALSSCALLFGEHVAKHVIYVPFILSLLSYWKGPLLSLAHWFSPESFKYCSSIDRKRNERQPPRLKALAPYCIFVVNVLSLKAISLRSRNPTNGSPSGWDGVPRAFCRTAGYWKVWRIEWRGPDLSRKNWNWHSW